MLNQEVLRGSLQTLENCQMERNVLTTIFRSVFQATKVHTVCQFIVEEQG